MATARVVWNDRAFGAKLRVFLRRRVQKAVNQVVADTQQRVSTPYPPASLPGQPPHLRSGDLMRSISGQVTATWTAITATVRASEDYAHLLDPGGGRIKRRPFLGLPQDLAKMVRIMTRG